MSDKTRNPNPFPYSDTNRRFYTFDYYLRRRFGRKCFKVPLDAGFTCPNIDGTKGRGGCTYCSLRLRGREILPLEEQFAAAVSMLERKWPDALHIAYFQDFSNTYGKSAEELRALYDRALALPETVGLSVATRADCIDEEKADLLAEYAAKTYLTVELGLQSSSDVTAERINRCHSWEDFLAGYRLLSERGINCCIHIIDGLPGEEEDDMMRTAHDVAALHPHEVKIHLLHVLRGTVLAVQYERGEFETLGEDEYTDMVVRQLEVLPPDTVIGRVTGDGMPDELIAPLWSRKKFVVMNGIDKKMAARDSWQGKYFTEKQKNG